MGSAFISFARPLDVLKTICQSQKNRKRPTLTHPRPEAIEIVRFDQVGLQYPGCQVLQNLNFSLRIGSFHFLTGVSGAGKTSLLKLIYRGILPTQGVVKVFGKDISRLSATTLPVFRQRIGLVLQDCRLLPHLSVVDNVALALTITGIKLSLARRQAVELLQWAGLGNHLKSTPPNLSDGQKQRVAIARAVITRPLILLADEPTGHLDHEAATRLVHLFQELNRIGTTILLATHSRSLVAEFPYGELHLYQGQLIANRQNPNQQSYNYA
ncbi:MAG: cell division protein FtsE [Alphaproteobacteria bacterium]|jgi:cell division transport system ATP-binding protein|nr:cell division protein FtsE [Alphaproteobacteria bacterium]